MNQPAVAPDDWRLTYPFSEISVILSGTIFLINEEIIFRIAYMYITYTTFKWVTNYYTIALFIYLCVCVYK